VGQGHALKELCKGDSRKTGRQFSFIVRRELSQISAISKIVDIAIRKFSFIVAQAINAVSLSHFVFVIPSLDPHTPFVPSTANMSSLK
jgi:hypothetical protein